MIRRATAEDADAIAHVLTSARAEQEWMPKIYTPEGDRSFVRHKLMPTHEVWVVEEEGSVVGFTALQGSLLGHIFVHPHAQGRGVGRALMKETKRLRPEGFTLWTHQPN